MKTATNQLFNSKKFLTLFFAWACDFFLLQLKHSEKIRFWLPLKFFFFFLPLDKAERRFVIMDFFKDLHDIPESEYVDSKNKIRDYMTEADLASEKTIEKRIAFFKKCMYYCSSCHANPAFQTLAKDALGLNDELINIHELMYKFFVKEQHCLNFTVLTHLYDKYDSSSFSWHVSPITLPFLSARRTALSTGQAIYACTAPRRKRRCAWSSATIIFPMCRRTRAGWKCGCNGTARSE